MSEQIGLQTKAATAKRAEEGDSAWQIWKWPTSVRWSRIFQPVR